jgi:hypothetical protein
MPSTRFFLCLGFSAVLSKLAGGLELKQLLYGFAQSLDSIPACCIGGHPESVRCLQSVVDCFWYCLFNIMENTGDRISRSISLPLSGSAESINCADLMKANSNGTDN